MSQPLGGSELEQIREKVRDGATTRATLTLLFVRLLELNRPTWKIEMASEAELKLNRPDASTSTIYLQNLWVECEQVPEERLEIVERWLRILLMEDEDSHPEIGQVIPLVRASEYRSYVKEEDRELIAPHLVGDLWIVYAIDLLDSTKVLDLADVARLGLDAESLKRTSIENLAKLLTDIEAEPYGGCFVFSCENIVYASSLLLLDFLWDQVASIVQGEIVAGIPARDTVIFTGADDASALVELRREVAYVFANGHHHVTETLLRRSNGSWKVFS